MIKRSKKIRSVHCWPTTNHVNETEINDLMIRFWIEAKTKINVSGTIKSSVPSFKKNETLYINSRIYLALSAKISNKYEKAIWGVVEKGKTKFHNKTFWKFLVQAIVEFSHLLHSQTFWIKRRRRNEKEKKIKTIN